MRVGGGLTLLAAVPASAALLLVCLLTFTLGGQQTAKQAAVSGHCTQTKPAHTGKSVQRLESPQVSQSISQPVRTLINEAVTFKYTQTGSEDSL